MTIGIPTKHLGTKPGESRRTVCMHAWALTEDGSQEHCDQDDPRLEGWCVYTRVEGDGDGEFDLSAEMDFDGRDDARIQAEARAAMLGCDLVIY